MNEKVVGIAAVTYKDNFGSALQTYATQRAINELGIETRIFDITGVHKYINFRKVSFYLQRVFEPDEGKYLFSNLISRTRKKQVRGEYGEEMAIRHAQYVAFNEKYLKMFPRVNSWDELTKQSMHCSAVVVGSDQLWRPSNIAGGYYTLDFVPDQIPKVAYATSFGVSTLPKVQLTKAKKFLQRMTAISVREITGQKIVKDVADIDIPVVCDPTMLFSAENWMTIQTEEPIIKGKYILCYFLGDNMLHREFAKKLKTETGCKIVALLHGATYIPEDNNFADEAPFDIGPSDFINLVRNAEYMCTDSFHGTVFSILNTTKFFSFRRYEDSSAFSTNDRLHTLLARTQLTDQLLCGTEDVKEVLSHSIDFQDALCRVKEFRDESLRYLQKALKIIDRP